MTNKEAIGILRELNERRKVVHAEDVGPLKVRSDRITQSIDMAIAALEKQEGKKPITVETNIYDTEEIHHGCTVQVLRNSVTGEVSVGWWKEKKEEE